MANKKLLPAKGWVMFFGGEDTTFNNELATFWRQHMRQAKWRELVEHLTKKFHHFPVHELIDETDKVACAKLERLKKNAAVIVYRIENGLVYKSE